MQQHIVAAGAGPDYDWANDHIFVKAPRDLTDGRVTVVEDVLKPGFNLPRHQHRTMVEIFYVLAGEAIFTFDDETVTAGLGATVAVPAGLWHAASSPSGARLLTIFTPGGFDHYLAELAALPPQSLADEATVTALGEKFDIWTR
jgi:quercetin dioxygenase-like cupin family protein